MQTVKQHVHTREVKSGDLFFLTVYFTNLSPMDLHLIVDIEQQRARTTGEVKHAAQLAFVPGRRVLAVECDNARQNGAHLLRCVEFTCFLATTGGELPYEVFVGVTQNIASLVKLRQFLLQGDDYIAHHLITRSIILAQFLASEVDFGEQPFESAFERLLLDVVETVGKFGYEFDVLRARQLVNRAP